MLCMSKHCVTWTEYYKTVTISIRSLYSLRTDYFTYIYLCWLFIYMFVYFVSAIQLVNKVVCVWCYLHTLSATFLRHVSEIVESLFSDLDPPVCMCVCVCVSTINGVREWINFTQRTYASRTTNKVSACPATISTSCAVGKSQIVGGGSVELNCRLHQYGSVTLDLRDWQNGTTQNTVNNSSTSTATVYVWG